MTTVEPGLCHAAQYQPNLTIPDSKIRFLINKSLASEFVRVTHSNEYITPKAEWAIGRMINSKCAGGMHHLHKTIHIETR